jgi:hypothetical protein
MTPLEPTASASVEPGIVKGAGGLLAIMVSSMRGTAANRQGWRGAHAPSRLAGPFTAPELEAQRTIMEINLVVASCNSNFRMHRKHH